MKNVFFVVCAALFLGCSGQVPQSEKSATTDDDRGGVISSENFEDNENEVLEVPPQDSLPLSEILIKLEVVGYTQIIDVEFEDGVWEVEYVVDGEEHELRVDPLTGEVLPEHQQEDGEDGLE